MSGTAKWLVIAGCILIVIGLAWPFLGKWLGKLPGDIVIRKQHGTFYFPIVTCLLISIVLSVIGYLLRFFR